MSSALLLNGTGAKLLGESGRPSLQSRRGTQVRVCAVKASSESDKGLSKHAARVLLAPLAAFVVETALPSPAHAGFLTDLRNAMGQSILESVEKMHAGRNERARQYIEKEKEVMRTSPLIQDLLRRSEKNRAKHEQAIADKYCIRQGQMGVGDCAAAFKSKESRTEFLAMLKQKRADQAAQEAAQEAIAEANTSVVGTVSSTEVTAQ